MLIIIMIIVIAVVVVEGIRKKVEGISCGDLRVLGLRVDGIENDYGM
jgi:hypothetical protein